MIVIKVMCVFPMVISSEFHFGKYRDDDHRDDAPHCIFWLLKFWALILSPLYLCHFQDNGMVKTEPAHERITSSPGMLRIDETKSPESHRSRSNPSPEMSSANQNQPPSESTNQTSSSFHSSIIQNSNSVLRSAIMPTSSVPNHYPVRKCPMTSSDISCLSSIHGYESSVMSHPPV